MKTDTSAYKIGLEEYYTELMQKKEGGAFCFHLCTDEYCRKTKAVVFNGRGSLRGDAAVYHDSHDDAAGCRTYECHHVSGRRYSVQCRDRDGKQCSAWKSESVNGISFDGLPLPSAVWYTCKVNGCPVIFNNSETIGKHYGNEIRVCFNEKMKERKE
jgi:hypothetical protein